MADELSDQEYIDNIANALFTHEEAVRATGDADLIAGVETLHESLADAQTAFAERYGVNIATRSGGGGKPPKDPNDPGQPAP